MEIEKIDPNFSTFHPPVAENTLFYDVKKPPFRVYGLYDATNQAPFLRMPRQTAENVSAGVSRLAYQTAGGRVRFATDAKEITVYARLNHISRFAHMPLSGSAGFDLYVETDGKERYLRSYIPSPAFENEYSICQDVGDKGMRYYTLNLPSYSGVDTLWIGVNKGATVLPGISYANELPIVYYGSSITQGACASRPGNAYTNIISRRLQLDHINLGFSGNGKGEPSIAEYMSELPMLAFVSDYDHNAPSPAHLEETHLSLYRTIRKKHPNIPYIILSKCDVDKKYEDAMARRAIIQRTYETARSEGDKNVYFIDGATVYTDRYRENCTVDGCHPGDLGMALIADALEAILLPLFPFPCKS